MQATVRLEEYLRYNNLHKGQEFTYVHWDTGYPAKVAYVRRCKNKDKIRVERLFTDPRDNCLWTVDISACHIQITI
jgi:hypothetical protein